MINFMKENTEYLELFIIDDDTEFQQGPERENVTFFHIKFYRKNIKFS